MRTTSPTVWVSAWEGVAALENGLRLVPLGPAEVPESCSFRPFSGIDFPPLREPRPVKAADIAAVHAPYLTVFRQ